MVTGTSLHSSSSFNFIECQDSEQLPRLYRPDILAKSNYHATAMKMSWYGLSLMLLAVLSL